MKKIIRIACVLIFLMSTNTAKSQTPCFGIFNHLACPIQVNYKIVDSNGLTICGGNKIVDSNGLTICGGNLTISQNTLHNFTSTTCCNSAVDIYVQLLDVNGASAGMWGYVNGVLAPTNCCDSGTAATTCNGGTWTIGWGAGSGIVHVN